MLHRRNVGLIQAPSVLLRAATPPFWPRAYTPWNKEGFSLSCMTYTWGQRQGGTRRQEGLPKNVGKAPFLPLGRNFCIYKEEFPLCITSYTLRNLPRRRVHRGTLGLQRNYRVLVSHAMMFVWLWGWIADASRHGGLSPKMLPLGNLLPVKLAVVTLLLGALQ